LEAEGNANKNKKQGFESFFNCAAGAGPARDPKPALPFLHNYNCVFCSKKDLISTHEKKQKVFCTGSGTFCFHTFFIAVHQ
jgi:hypothetical protein